MKTAISAIEMINTSSPCFDQNSRNLIMSAATDGYCCSFRPAYVPHFSKRIATICAMISFIRSSTAFDRRTPDQTRRVRYHKSSSIHPDLMGIFDDGYQQAIESSRQTAAEFMLRSNRIEFRVEVNTIQQILL